MSSCRHRASGQAYLDRDAGRMRCAVVCDECGTQLLDVHDLEYQPDPLDLGVPGGPSGASRP